MPAKISEPFLYVILAPMRLSSHVRIAIKLLGATNGYTIYWRTIFYVKIPSCLYCVYLHPNFRHILKNYDGYFEELLIKQIYFDVFNDLSNLTNGVFNLLSSTELRSYIYHINFATERKSYLKFNYIKTDVKYNVACIFRYDICQCYMYSDTTHFFREVSGYTVWGHMCRKPFVFSHLICGIPLGTNHNKIQQCSIPIK